jgi:cob(I)alamin adenosyltransferase
LEPEVKIFRFERGQECFQDLSEEQKREEKQNIINGLNFAKKALVTEECDLLVLDEVLGVVEEGMATEEELLNVLKARSLFTSVILTGTNLPEQIADFADEVMNIVAEK